MIVPFGTRHSALAALVTVLSLLCTVASADEDFTVGALRGLQRVQVVIEGVAPSFARYGLTVPELHRRVAAQLVAAGIALADANAAQNDVDVAQVRIKLTTVEAVYSLYSYAVAVQVRRKLALGGDGHGFVSQQVWSRGQNGVINPSDLPNVYGYADTLMAAFIAAIGVDNAAARAAAPQ